MIQESEREETANLLQELGLKEYEARSFVALTRLPTGTAKDISEISEVPRTRVYNAIDVLEAQGLVEVQHGSPKRFRAVGVEEAVEILRQKHNARIDTLEAHLQNLEPLDEADPQRQEVWSMTGREAIRTRTAKAIAGAASEIVMLVVEEALLTDRLVDRLRAAQDRGATLIVGGATDEIASHAADELPDAQVFETDLEWLMGPSSDGEVAISSVFLVDREAFLVSSFYPDGGDAHPEQAIFATGLDNGVVVLLRRLMATGLLPSRDVGA